MSSVDLPRLVVLVRVRRVLRLGSRLATAALPLWLVVVISLTASNEEQSPTHRWVDAHANRGFVIILVILALDLVLSASVRLFGDAGVLATRLVPFVRGLPDPELTGRGIKPGELLDAGSRPRTVPPPGRSKWPAAVMGLVLVALIAVAAVTGSRIHAQYRASHGQGGPIVTLGENSRITRTLTESRTVKKSRSVAAYSYYISSPRGEALVEGDDKPASGTRFAIVPTSDGLHAVHVGGYSWVTSLVVTVVSSLLGLAVLWSFRRRFRARLPDECVLSLVTTLDQLSRGSRVSVQAVPRSVRRSASPAVVLTAAVPHDRDAAGWVRRRTHVATAAVVALLAVAGIVTAVA